MKTDVETKAPSSFRLARAALATLFALLIGFVSAAPSSATTVQASAVQAVPAAPTAVATAGPKTDCGPMVQVVCKKTWDKATTKSFYEAQTQWWWAWMRAKYVAKFLPVPGVVAGDKALDRMEDATADAVIHDGCLQATYRKNGKGMTDWGYTTNCH